MLDRIAGVSPLVLTTKTGRSLKKCYFGRLWREAMGKAGLQSVLVCTENLIRVDAVMESPKLAE
jgi:hypothetical protein